MWWKNFLSRRILYIFPIAPECVFPSWVGSRVTRTKDSTETGASATISTAINLEELTVDITRIRLQSTVTSHALDLKLGIDLSG